MPPMDSDGQSRRLPGRFGFLKRPLHSLWLHKDEKQNKKNNTDIQIEQCRRGKYRLCPVWPLLLCKRGNILRWGRLESDRVLGS